MIKPYSKWTRKQTMALLDSIGSFGWSAIQRRTGHTKTEIWAKIKREYEGGGITRGSYSAEQAKEETGYSRTQLERASKALNQRWLRTAKRGNYLITAEQLEDMVVWLRNDYWSKKHRLYVCMQCEKEDFPHFAMGLCYPCYKYLKCFVLTELEIPFKTSSILEKLDLNLDRSNAISKKDGMFMDQLYDRLENGKCPPIKDLNRAIVICNF